MILALAYFIYIFSGGYHSAIMNAIIEKKKAR